MYVSMVTLNLFRIQKDLKTVPANMKSRDGFEIDL